ncbi:MAG: ABC transporter ATP-binding protein [Kiritimatiellia bacterium]
MKIRLDNIRKRFGGTTALDGVSLEIDDGEIFFLLGPSGCGKTTLLRIIAGFCDPDAGALMFDAQAVTHTPPHRRRTAMVFQNYALWPHMTVAENVAFGLTMPDRGNLSRAERTHRVQTLLATMHLTDLAKRKPTQLSGGQQQRVALARALAVRPACLLLDEPLSNLDAKLRQEMRVEIRRVIKQTGITAVYVTHDQQEALSMADRCALMRDGRIVQTGTPTSLYREPVDCFAADFIGGANIFTGIMHKDQQSGNQVVAGQHTWHGRPTGRLPAVGAKAAICVRPESIRLSPNIDSGTANNFPVHIAETLYLGHATEYWLRLPEGPLLRAHSGVDLQVGAEAFITVNPDDVMILPDTPG